MSSSFHPVTFILSLQTSFVTWDASVKAIVCIGLNSQGSLRKVPHAPYNVMQSRLCHRKHFVHRSLDVRDNILMSVETFIGTWDLATSCAYGCHTQCSERQIWHQHSLHEIGRNILLVLHVTLQCTTWESAQRCWFPLGSTLSYATHDERRFAFVIVKYEHQI